MDILGKDVGDRRLDGSMQCPFLPKKILNTDLSIHYLYLRPIKGHRVLESIPAVFEPKAGVHFGQVTADFSHLITIHVFTKDIYTACGQD